MQVHLHSCIKYLKTPILYLHNTIHCTCNIKISKFRYFFCVVYYLLINQNDNYGKLMSYYSPPGKTIRRLHFACYNPLVMNLLQIQFHLMRYRIFTPGQIFYSLTFFWRTRLQCHRAMSVFPFSSCFNWYRHFHTDR